MNKWKFIKITIILVLICLVFFGIFTYSLIKEARNNFIVINNELVKTIKYFKKQWNYKINEYKKLSYIPVYTQSGELYAELVPDIYTSNKEFNIKSNELRSLLYIEDKGFLFRDFTFSIKGLMRAIYNIHFKNIKQWWSGITQQLVKNVVLKTNESSISRKYKELLISYYIENNLPKLEILNAYLNRVSYWKNIYWIEQAWLLYLWKEELKLEDAFLLNSMLKQPTYYYNNQDKLKQRAKYYLSEYLKENWISKDRVKLSLDYIDTINLKFRNHNKLNWVNEYIRDKAMTYSKNNKIDKITLNYDISLIQEQDITNKIREEEKRICKEYQACDIWIVVLNNSWTINFLYWWDYSKSQVDSTSSMFELWSTLKPFIYWKYFDTYWIKTSVNNSKICIWDYCPQNWDKSSSSTVSFNKAINLSYNLPVIHIAKEFINLNDLNDIFISLWLYNKDDKDLNYSMVLGTKQSTLLKLTNAYYSLFNGKFKKSWLFDSDKEEKEIFSEKSITYIKNTLKNNGYNNKYTIKTGTSDEFKDNYIIWINDKHIIWIWMWNKNWSKTKKDIFSITKWWGLFNILSKYY